MANNSKRFEISHYMRRLIAARTTTQEAHNLLNRTGERLNRDIFPPDVRSKIDRINKRTDKLMGDIHVLINDLESLYEETHQDEWS